MTRLLMVAAALAAVLAAAGVGAGAEWDVYPGAGTVIQDAINASHPGDTIYVHAGLYYENLNVGKRLTLIGDGADVVTVRVARTYHVFEVTADWVNISGFTVVGATSWQNAGIYLYYADHCNISENNVSNGDYGIYLSSSSNNMLSSNTANSNGDYGIYLRSSSNNMLPSNTANSNGAYGIRLYKSSGNTLSSNIVNSNDDDGIMMKDSSGNTLSSNIVNSNGDNGIYMYSSSSNALTNNTMNSNNNDGICMQYSSSNALSSNTVNSNGDGGGICLEYSCNYNTLSSNTANSNDDDGIYMYASCNYNTLNKNTANSNNDNGIYLRSSDNNMLYSNTANSNGDNGIRLYKSSDYNTLHHNNLIDNTNYNAYDECTTQWDSGTEGNYYSDYIGTDSDNDGIGDTHHPIPGGSNVDRYPLMEPWKEPQAHNINTGVTFSTIQAAIDDPNTQDGHTITVDAGTYVENVNVDKSLTIRSVSGNPEDTIVQAADSNDHVFEVTASYVNIGGFTIKGVATENYKAEIYLYYVDHCNISDNNVLNSVYYIYTYGILLKYSSNNIINNNSCSNNWHGIDLGSSCNNTILRNTVSNNYAGVDLSHSSNNTFSNNIISDNTDGIELVWYSSNNTIVNNNVLNNHRIDFGYYSSNNNIYLNNFININIVNFYESTNIWNSTSPITYTYNGNTYTNYLGNYWDDYTDIDADDDGIWDNPYSIDSDKDNHPLTSHFEDYITPTTWLPPEITRSRLGINTHWNHWADDLSIYKEKTKNFGIVRDQAWWAGLETSDLTGSEWDHANWYYPYDTETLCGREIPYQSGLDNLVKLYQGEDSPELLLLLNLKNDEIKTSLKWEVTLEEKLPRLCEGVFALANDILYVSVFEGTGEHGKLYALDASTGSEKWSFDTGAIGMHTPAVANGIVYICGWQNGMVYALDATTGVEKWHYKCDGIITSSPIIADGVLYVGAYDKLYAFGTLGEIPDADSPWTMSKYDATRTGYNSDETALSPPLVKIWEFQGVSGDYFDTISSANGILYVGMQASIESWADSNKVYAIDATTGLKRWEFILDGGGSGAMDVTPAVANGLVYFGGQGDDKLYALDAETGQKVWEFAGMGSMYCSHPAVVDGVVYVGGLGMLYALNASTGVKIWEFPTIGGRSPAIVDGTLYIGSSDGFLYAIDAKTGTEKWNLSDASRAFSYPLIANGTVYMDTSSTVIKALDTSSFETITADQYYDYVYHVVERYDRDGVSDMPGLIRPVRYFEVGNEVDYTKTGDSRHGYLSPEDYVEKRLIPAYNAAKAANEDAIVMGSGLGMESDLKGGKIDKFNTAYLEAMYDNITANDGSRDNNFYMDKIAIHYYSQNEHPEYFDENIKEVEDIIMNKEGREKPIWITEFAPASTPSLYARLLTLMFANKIEMPVIYNLKDEDDSEEGFGLYNVTCVGEEETITPRESIQVIDTVLSTLHGTTPSETENEDISVEPGKTTYQRVFNNSGKKVTVLWYIDTADPGAVTNCVIFPESPQTFTVDVLGTANFSQTSSIHLTIGSEPTYVVETDPPIDVDLYFNKTTTVGVSTERATGFAVGDTMYGKIETSTSTDHTVKTYLTMTMPDGTCRYAHYDKPDFNPGSDNPLFSYTKTPLYNGVWHTATNDWLWNIYEFTGGDSGTYRWNCWYEDAETGEILGGNSTEYNFSETPSGTPIGSATGEGEVYLDSSAGAIENIAAIPLDAMPEVPESLNPVYGFFSFEITGISSGECVNIPLAFPENVPTGTEYWKYGPTPEDSTPHWYQIPVSDDDGDRIIVITLTDGGIGDDDLTVNGVIVDDGGPSLPKKGDLNSDGILTPADAAIALRIAASGAHDDAADVSGDGSVTSLDALMILQAAAGRIEL